MSSYVMRAAVAAITFILALSAIQADAKPARTLRQRIIALERRLDAVERHRLKHAWPDLSGKEKRAITQVAKTLPPTVKFDIVCNDGACTDLAYDIDDALEQAGLSSDVDHSLGPLAYGIYVQINDADRAAAEKALTMLKGATRGRLDPQLLVAQPGKNPEGYVTILIGKYRR